MSLKSLKDKLSALKANAEPGSKNGDYETVAEKITKHTAKKGGRKSGTPVQQNPTMRKILKRAARLADLMSEEDAKESEKILFGAMQATRRYFNFETKRVEYLPDCRTRLAAVALLLAYTEGLPVQRVRQDRAEMETGEEIMARLRQSPEAMRAVCGLQQAGVKLTHGDEVIDIDASVQETVAANL